VYSTDIVLYITAEPPVRGTFRDNDDDDDVLQAGWLAHGFKVLNLLIWCTT